MPACRRRVDRATTEPVRELWATERCGAGSRAPQNHSLPDSSRALAVFLRSLEVASLTVFALLTGLLGRNTSTVSASVGVLGRSRVMRKNWCLSVGVLVGAGLWLAGCSGSKSSAVGGSAGTGSAAGGSSGGLAGAVGSAGASYCTPLAKRCDGLKVKQCDDSGSSETIT